MVEITCLLFITLWSNDNDSQYMVMNALNINAHHYNGDIL